MSCVPGQAGMTTGWKGEDWEADMELDLDSPSPSEHNLGSDQEFDFIVVGGGIAGVSCVEQLTTCMPEARVLLISDSSVVQQATNVTRITKTLQDFVIVEKSLPAFREVHKSVTVVHDALDQILDQEQILLTRKKKSFKYGLLCLCMGASPLQLNPKLLIGKVPLFTLRDAKSVARFGEAVGKSRRGLVIGNGGIATEFVFEADAVEIVWSIKDGSMAKHYLDSGAAEFLLRSRAYVKCPEAQKETDCEEEEHSAHFPQERIVPQEADEEEEEEIRAAVHPNRDEGLEEVPSSAHFLHSGPVKRQTFELEKTETRLSSVEPFGSALGPDWHKGFEMRGQAGRKKLRFEPNTILINLFNTSSNQGETWGIRRMMERLICEEAAEESRNWPAYVLLSNGRHFGVDWILAALGTEANSRKFEGAKAEGAEGAGVMINQCMHTSLPHVFAAGDLTKARWKFSEDWFQMNLWTQARTAGMAAGEAMLKAFELDSENEAFRSTPTEKELKEGTGEEHFSFGFEVFTHVTRFFGFKIVLLGHFNGFPPEEKSQRIKLRVTMGKEYVKVILVENRVRGAILMGETGLEETLENLILNRTDISGVEEDLLNPSLDLEDYFD